MRVYIYNLRCYGEGEGVDPVHQLQPGPDVLRSGDAEGVQGVQAEPFD